MKFKGDIIITDPCYIIKKDSEDWRKCDYGDNMAALGLTNYISESFWFWFSFRCITHSFLLFISSF